MNVTILTFGRKYGMPEADVVFDARCLENPYWMTALRPLSGRDKAVRDYIMRFPDGAAYIERLCGLACLQASLASARGCQKLTFAVGCTGGRHRSVTVGILLARALEESGFPVTLMHRDIEKG